MEAGNKSNFKWTDRVQTFNQNGTFEVVFFPLQRNKNYRMSKYNSFCAIELLTPISVYLTWTSNFL